MISKAQMKAGLLRLGELLVVWGFFIFFAVTAAWILLLILIGLLFEVILAPNTFGSTVDYGPLTLVMVIGAACTWVVGWRWVTEIPDDSCHVGGRYDESVSPVVRHFRVRSGSCRLAAAGLFVLLAFVTVFGFFAASSPARNLARYHEGLPLRIPDLVERLVETEAGRQLIQDAEVADLMAVVVEHGAYPRWTETVGSLVLLLVLAQVMASIFRYMIRLAAFYDSRADYLQLGGTVEGLGPEELLRVVDATGVVGGRWRGLTGRSPRDDAG
ncbi:MAG: hypothetical protein OXS47_11715 [Chloroflexota bacterium]|nr:hypothetical protein [Chloroflexota bacterium]